MRRIIYIALCALVPLSLLHWSQTHHVPNWLIILTATPLLVTGYRSNDGDTELGSGFSALFFFIVGGGAILLGIIGLALRGSGSLAELLAYALPAGVIALVIGIAILWRDSRQPR